MTWQRNATDLGARAMNRMHRFLLTISGGRILRTAFGMPVLELHTVGRRSGQRRSVMLTTPISGPDRILLAAYQGYGSYQRRTERDIPVVICEPRPA